jgi:uncharacterized membrane protein
MKIRIALLAFALMLVSSVVHAESFKVLHFHSDITLNLDGSFDVVEDVFLEFSESRHGFIRKLPYRYTPAPNVQGEIAEGHKAGLDYFTPIAEIVVEDRAFTVTKNYSDYEIKIGSAEEYVSGRQRYRIHYKVYGAINFFSKTSEFYWNVNGNDWDVDFDTLDATVILPTNKKIADADLQVFTGALGAILGGAAVVSEPGKVQFLGTRKLGPKEGMTISLRMPKGYLRHDPVPLRMRADVYMIDTLQVRATLAEDGSVEVEETYYLDILKPATDLKMTYSTLCGGLLADGTAATPIEYEILSCKVRQLDYDFTAYATLAPTTYLGAEKEMTITGTSFPKEGKYELRLRYRIWGAAQKHGNGVLLTLPMITTTPDAPLASAHLSLSWRGSQPIDLKNVTVSDFIPPKGQVHLGAEQLRIDYKEPFATGERSHFWITLPQKQLAIAQIPMRVFSPDHYFTFYHVDIEVKANGMVHVSNKFGVYQSTWYSPQMRPLMLEHSAWSSYEFSAGQPEFWGVKGDYLVDNLTFQGELVDYGYLRDHELRLNSPRDLQGSGTDTITFSYDIYGILADSGGMRLNFPLVEQLDAPADQISATIRYPGGALSEKDIQVWITPIAERDLFKNQAKQLSLHFEPGIVQVEGLGGMQEGQLLLINMQLPAGAVSSSLWLDLRLLWINHKTLFFPLFLLLPLFIIWMIWGRDKRFTTVVEFYPPEGLTPTEAGMLIDDKLHNRDLLALIYYWGAQGIISITELYDANGKVNDYQFVKLKKLPAGARKYEKTIFEKLFLSGNTTKVSAHNQTFSGTMVTARQEFETYVKGKNYYVPGTQGWATGMRIIGWIFVLITFCAAGLVLLQFSSWFRGRWEIPVGWAACTALLFFFARIMPKKAGMGQSQYEKLVGFREFVMRAEQAKLEELVHTNPDYFGMTLPYAISLGIATQWVDRFGDLLTAPPTYYHTNADADLDSMRRMQFAYSMHQQLDRMAHSFNSTPPAPSGGGGGGSSYSSSSSSSSYSSSGSSGGSSISSGGGYSGGGYGGGGGSSW